MPGPDPHALWIERDGSRVSVTFERYFWTGNAGNRGKRAIALLHRIQGGTWRCLRCGDALPDYRRADARYRRKACRKAAVRARRKARESISRLPLGIR